MSGAAAASTIRRHAHVRHAGRQPRRPTEADAALVWHDPALRPRPAAPRRTTFISEKTNLESVIAQHALELANAPGRVVAAVVNTVPTARAAFQALEKRVESSSKAWKTDVIPLIGRFRPIERDPYGNQACKSIPQSAFAAIWIDSDGFASWASDAAFGPDFAVEATCFAKRSVLLSRVGRLVARSAKGGSSRLRSWRSFRFPRPSLIPFVRLRSLRARF